MANPSSSCNPRSNELLLPSIFFRREAGRQWGFSFLLSVSDRLGFYGNPGGRGVSWGTFERFLRYAAKVNAFAPAWMIPILGTAATVLELLFGVTLILGLALRWAAFGSVGLLFLFGSAMAISFGIKSPFD